MANYKDLRYNFAISSTADVGAMKLIKTLTASSSATLSFVDGTSDVEDLQCDTMSIGGKIIIFSFLISLVSIWACFLPPVTLD